MKKICFVLALIIILSLTACSDKNSAESGNSNIIYSVSEITMPAMTENVSLIKAYEESIYIVGDSVNEMALLILDMDGNIMSENSLTGSDNIGDILGGTVDTKGNVCLIEVVTDNNGVSYYLSKYTTAGESIGKVNISEIDQKKIENYLYIDSVIVDDDGNLFLSCENTVYAFDTYGNLLLKNEFGASSNLGNLCAITDGRVVVHEIIYSGNAESSRFHNIDINSKSVSVMNETYMPIGSVASGNDLYDIIYSTSTSLRGYIFGSDTSDLIVDWVSTGFDSTAIEDLMIIGNDKIVCVTREYSTSGGGVGYYTDGNSPLSLFFLTKLDSSELQNKEEIKIATMYKNLDLLHHALRFNRSNSEYHISITVYGEEYDYDNAVVKFHNDVISGNIPDILILDYEMPIDSYISKGMFADLYNFIETDDEINRNDYLDNILNTYTVDEKLYSFIPAFQIYTFIGRTSVVGENPEWSTEEFLNIRKKYTDKNIICNQSATDFILQVLANEDIVNIKEGVCSFTSEEFIKLLELSRELPSVYEYDYEGELLSLSEDFTMLSKRFVSGFGDIRAYEHGIFGEPVTFKAFPGVYNNNAQIHSSFEFSIMSGSENQDAAWEFIRYFLTDEYQNSLENIFPVKMSAINEAQEKAKEKPFFMNENKKIEYENTYWIGGQSIEIGTNTDEDNEKILALITSLSKAPRIDGNVGDIIAEEVGAYFSGDKSAEKVAEAIQNRVKVYINEIQ